MKGSARISTGTISDVLDSIGKLGTLSKDMTSSNRSNHYFFGEAYTVQWAPNRKGHSILQEQKSTWNQVRKFLVPKLSSGKGKVYVAGAGPLMKDYALAGGLSLSYFSKIGFEGAVFGGAIRDREVVENLSIPVVCSNYTPADSQGNYCVTETGTNCVVENILINTGDWIYSDSTGTVVVPKDHLDYVLKESERIERIETLLMSEISNGRPLAQVIDEIGRI